MTWLLCPAQSWRGKRRGEISQKIFVSPLQTLQFPLQITAVLLILFLLFWGPIMVWRNYIHGKKTGKASLFSPPAYISSSCSPAIPYPFLSFFLFFPSLLLARFLQMTPSTFRKEGKKRMDSYRGNPLPRRQEHKRQKVKNKDGNKKEEKGGKGRSVP